MPRSLESRNYGDREELVFYSRFLELELSHSWCGHLSSFTFDKMRTCTALQKSTNMLFLVIRTIGDLRAIGALRPIRILFIFTKKNKMKKFPTKMKEKIGAPKGRQLYGAPKRALIIPNSVFFEELWQPYVFPLPGLNERWHRTQKQIAKREIQGNHSKQTKLQTYHLQTRLLYFLYTAYLACTCMKDQWYLFERTIPCHAGNFPL